MINAVLTIDDIASENTSAIIDYLCEKNIQVVMFAWGALVEQNYENALYAIKKGAIVGNHSFTHPHFSELSFEEAVDEIEKNEALLNRLYSDAGVDRKYKLFRFPYGDKGGANKDALQNYLKSNGFKKLQDSQIPYKWYEKEGLLDDVDVFWTFDFAEWQIREGADFGEEDVIKSIDAAILKLDNSMPQGILNNIFLIHAHDETERLAPEYYKHFIEYSISKGVNFIPPVIAE